jgi:hypothetical protein
MVKVVALPPKRSAPLRASVMLMAKLVTETVPAFVSYTMDDPSMDDLVAANQERMLLSAPENYLQFYSTVYRLLYDTGNHVMPLTSKTISFKNSFLSELLRLLVFEGSSKASFSERVQHFGAKHREHGVLVASCK